MEETLRTGRPPCHPFVMLRSRRLFCSFQEPYGKRAGRERPGGREKDGRGRGVLGHHGVQQRRSPDLNEESCLRVLSCVILGLLEPHFPPLKNGANSGKVVVRVK